MQPYPLTQYSQQEVKSFAEIVTYNYYPLAMHILSEIASAAAIAQQFPHTP